jgi:hypothetical protein
MTYMVSLFVCLFLHNLDAFLATIERGLGIRVMVNRFW